MNPLILLTAAIAVVGANSLALSPIAPAVAADLASTPERVLVAGAVYGAGTALSALTLAPQVDRVGLERALHLALGLLTLAMALTAFAPGVGWLIAAQALAGIGGGVALPATYGIATARAPEGQASRYLGRVLTGWTVSLVFGVTGAAVVADFLGWRWVFTFLALIAGATLALMVRGLGWPAPRPAAPPSLVAALRVPGVPRGLMACFCYMAAFYGLYAYLGTHLQVVLGVPVWASGMAPLVYGIGFAGAAWLDPVIDRRGIRVMAPVLLGGLVAFYLVLAALSFSATAIVSLSLVWGVVNHLTLNTIIGRLAALDSYRRGAILGLNSAVTYVAVFAGTLAFGQVYSWAGFAACAVASAGVLIPALWDAVRQR
jgi:MFS transporter, DHA1 family, inner membrane transport protein